MNPDAGLTDGTLLGGRVVYRQRRTGYRTGIEPVLLAACVPAGPGERVLEGGTGAGAGLLCLAQRVPDLAGLGLEIDAETATLARANFHANDLPDMHALAADLTAWTPTGTFDHAFANPPWHRASGTASADLAIRTAKMAQAGLLAAWARRLAAGLRRRGTLSLILPAANTGRGMAALAAAECPEIDVLPIRPHADTPARLVILRGVRHGGGADRILPELLLHQRCGGYTEAAERILRHGEPVGGRGAKP